MKKAITLDMVCYAIVLLFIYAALSKLLLYDMYIYDLKRSPFIGDYAAYLSLTVPIVEIAIALLLLIPKTRQIGLWGAFFVMLMFTGYVALILAKLDRADRPCTCGGLIRQLTWKQHLAFNIFYTGLTIVGIWLQQNLSLNLKASRLKLLRNIPPEK